MEPLCVIIELSHNKHQSEQDIFVWQWKGYGNMSNVPQMFPALCISRDVCVDEVNNILVSSYDSNTANMVPAAGQKQEILLTDKECIV